MKHWLMHTNQGAAAIAVVLLFITAPLGLAAVFYAIVGMPTGFAGMFLAAVLASAGFLLAGFSSAGGVILTAAVLVDICRA